MKRLLPFILFALSSCNGGAEEKQGSTVMPEPFPVSKAEAKAHRKPACLQSLPDGVRTPVRFIPIDCDPDRAIFWVPDKLFDTDGFSPLQHQLVIAGSEGVRFMTPQVDPKWFDRADAEQVNEDLVRITEGGSQGYDSILNAEIQPYLYLQRRTGGICASSNMSAQPRAFMVNCWLRTPRFTVIANGPQDEAGIILQRLSRIASEIKISH